MPKPRTAATRVAPTSAPRRSTTRTDSTPAPTAARARGTCPVCGQSVSVLKSGVLGKHTRVLRSTGQRATCRGRRPLSAGTMPVAIESVPLTPARARYRGLPSPADPPRSRAEAVRARWRRALWWTLAIAVVVTGLLALWVARWTGLSAGVPPG